MSQHPGNPLVYPGGRGRFLSRLRVPLVLGDRRQRFVEACCGSAAVTLEELLEGRMEEFWINDIDVGVFCFWSAVKNSPSRLIELTRTYRPDVAHFNKLKQFFWQGRLRPSNPDDAVEIGFYKLVLHRISHSGLGAMGGSARGGNSQRNSTVDARWYPENICEQIDFWHKILIDRNVRITNLDCGKVIADESVPSFVYIDPPYYVQGCHLYQHSFTQRDHLRLSSVLRTTPHLWLLSYDDCPEVRAMYYWAAICEIPATYHVTEAKASKELVIAPSRRLLRYLETKQY